MAIVRESPPKIRDVLSRWRPIGERQAVRPKVPGMSHCFSHALAAWNQGSFGSWPKFKTDYSMGYFKHEDIPFQFALAEAFIVCDAYYCSTTSGTDPNRIVFWSGSNFDPAVRAKGFDCRNDKWELNNLSCCIYGALPPDPGYTCAGNALEWPTLPDVLGPSPVAGNGPVWGCTCRAPHEHVRSGPT